MDKSTVKALHSADEVIAHNNRTIEALSAMHQPMKAMGDTLEHYDDEDEQDLPINSPMEVFSHLRATGRGV